MNTGNGTARFVARWCAYGIIGGLTGYGVMLVSIRRDSTPLALVTLSLWGFSIAAVLIVIGALWLDRQNRRSLRRLEREGKLSNNKSQ